MPFCRCGKTVTFDEFRRLQMLANKTFDGGNVHIKACSVCGAEIVGTITHYNDAGIPVYEDIDFAKGLDS